MNTKLALKEYGLTDKETEVYLKLLSLGNINLQEIAKKVQYPRTTVYNTLYYLSKKGLVSKIVKKGVTYFEASPPREIVEDINQKKKLLQKVLPELESLRKNIISSSSAEIYEGSKGLFRILSDVFSKKQQTYYFGSYTLSTEILKSQPDHLKTIRIEKKIPAKIIIDPSDDPSFHTNKYKKITEMRFLASLKDFPCMIFIYGNKVALYTLEGGLVGVIISNKETARALKLIFDTLWNLAKPAKI